MRKILLLPLLAFLAACTDDGLIAPDGGDVSGPRFAKKCDQPPCPKDGDDGGVEGPYTIIDLGTLGGKGSSSRAADISDPAGAAAEALVVGYGDQATGNTVATFWTVTTTAGVPTASDPQPIDPEPGRAYGTSSSGAYAAGYVGDANILENSLPVIWIRDGSTWQRQELGLPGNDHVGVAYDVNDAGVAVGYVMPTPGLPPTLATVWMTPEDPQQLPTLTPGVPLDEHSRAVAINTAGYAVGMSTLNPDGDPNTGAFFHAVLWMPGGDGNYAVCDLHSWPVPDINGPMAGYVLHSSASGISEDYSENGSQFVKVSGGRTLYGGTGAANIWTVDLTDCADGKFDGQPEDLGSTATAKDINSLGEIPGAYRGRNPLPIVWTAEGVIVELATLGGDSGSAEAINETGQIVGWTKVGKGNHAVLWNKKSQ